MNLMIDMTCGMLWELQFQVRIQKMAEEWCVKISKILCTHRFELLCWFVDFVFTAWCFDAFWMMIFVLASLYVISLFSSNFVTCSSCLGSLLLFIRTNSSCKRIVYTFILFFFVHFQFYISFHLFQSTAKNSVCFQPSEIFDTFQCFSFSWIKKKMKGKTTQQKMKTNVFL